MSDKVFPLTIASVGIVAVAILLVRMILVPEGHDIFADRESGGEDASAEHGLWSTLGWFASLLVLSALLGFILALAIFMLAFFRVRARVSWTLAAICTGSGIAFMLFLARILRRDFPPGLLQDLTNLPWPFN